MESADHQNVRNPRHPDGVWTFLLCDSGKGNAFEDICDDVGGDDDQKQEEINNEAEKCENRRHMDSPFVNECKYIINQVGANVKFFIVGFFLCKGRICGILLPKEREQEKNHVFSP